MYKLQNKVILITGGCGGLGFAFAKELLRNKALGVSLIDIDDAVGETKVEELGNEFGKERIIFVKASVDDPESFKNAFEVTVRKFNQLDIVINNAGIFDERNWRKCVDVNLKGTIEGTNLALNILPRYKSSEEGVILNIASVAGLYASNIIPMYTATKYGVVGLTKAYGHESCRKEHGIRMLCICPGNTKTNIYAPHNFSSANLADVKLTLGVMSAQEPIVVASALCKMIETAKHGTFWTVENGKAYELAFSPDEPAKKLLFE